MYCHKRGDKQKRNPHIPPVEKYKNRNADCEPEQHDSENLGPERNSLELAITSDVFAENPVPGDPGI